MKKVLCVLAVLLCILATAAAEVDLSGMNYDELVALKDQINKAIWESQEWQEVTVPQGVWRVGEDIPAGHWTVSVPFGGYISFYYCENVTEMHEPDRQKPYRSQMLLSPERTPTAGQQIPSSVDQEMRDGMYVIIGGGDAIFTPYSGKPSLEFK